ncbi:sugar transporter permease [Mycolicibacterium litorale]|uniref:Sugar transporter permease n=1 Tax=Mycolicibacterium litorale TaxID=758802 RepID=A0A6S6P3D9_9MYCO|nr:ABC transporter permease [Mycolicibacterium litorale]BCI54353.1 sugar transporter permease [Mycolicibacterium litorale]
MTFWERRASLRAPRLSTTATGLVTAATIALGAIATVTIDAFPTASNIRGLCLSVSLIGIIAVGLSFITIAGQVFSLSIPALVALCTITFASSGHLGVAAAVLLTVVLGTAIGAIQGVVVGRFAADPIIVTIASAAILVGLGQLWTNGQTVLSDGDNTVLNVNLLGFLPFQTAVFLVLTIAVLGLLRQTVFGRQLTLFGLNERAALLSGYRRTVIITAAFAISGATTGLAGALLAAQSNQGQLMSGAGLGFDAIVAVVVGGVAIAGGIGTPVGAAVGAVFAGLLNNVASLAGLSYEMQLVTEGALILLVVLLSGFLNGRSTR